MNRFATLMYREWLQHRAGWLVVMALPSALMLLFGLFEGHGLQVNVADADGALPPLHEWPAALQTLGWTAAAAVVGLLLAGLTVLAQLPGLARRDMQDRSIEFWRSLPTGDAQSIGATLLMHLLVLPGLALIAGLLGAQVVATLGIVSHQGPLVWLQQPWGELLAVGLGLAGRLLLGLLLAVAWLSPLLLLTLAASAWLKRWAVPVLLAVAIFGVQWLDRQLPQALVKPTLDRLATEGWNALLPIHALQGLQLHGMDDAVAVLPALPGLLLRDTGHALGNAATPAFLSALLVAALGFALLVWRRQHTA
jgi:hypothetical protein